MTDWHRENGYIRNFAIIAAFEMSQLLFKRLHENPDVDLDHDMLWFFVEAGAELNEFQFMRVNWELTTY